MLAKQLRNFITDYLTTFIKGIALGSSYLDFTSLQPQVQVHRASLRSGAEHGKLCPKSNFGL